MKTTTTVQAIALPSAPAADEAVKSRYLESLHLVERLHRRLLEVIKHEFERRGHDEVNAVQALLLYNIGDKELTASELRTRGYYLGSNVSYNVKKLVETGYLHHARSRIDRRAVRISLTDKGRRVHDLVQALYDKHARTIEPVGGLSFTDFERLNRALSRLERFWTDQIRFRL
jgi:DNA-binding MarR family transcriptional regulator